jgi:DNA-binding transcriptional LysR family regulator
MSRRNPLSVPGLAARLDLQTLQIFLTVAETGSLTEAAVRGHLVVSAVSRRVAALEQLLGTTLLERRHDGVAPTAAGRELVERIHELSLVLERMQEGAEAHRAGLRGEVRVHANTSALLDRLPGRIASFLAMHPAVDVRLKEWDSAQVVRSVREGVAHVGVYSSYVPAQGLETFTLTETRLVLVAPEHHPIAAAKAVRFEDTLQHDYVVLQDGESFSALLTHMHGIARRFSAPMRIRIKAASVGAACRFVEAGLGITLVPATSASLFSGKLRLVEVELLDDWAAIRHDICVREEAALPPVARRLVEHLRSGT